MGQDLQIALFLTVIIADFGLPDNPPKRGERQVFMAQTKEKIIQEIDSHIQKEHSGYRNWYVGIAKDPRDRLFNDHNVTEHGGWWIYREAYSDTSAREVESFFLDYKGTQGGPGGGDEDSRFVYAYRITSATKE